MCTHLFSCAFAILSVVNCSPFALKSANRRGAIIIILSVNELMERPADCKKLGGGGLASLKNSAACVALVFRGRMKERQERGGFGGRC